MCPQGSGEAAAEGVKGTLEVTAPTLPSPTPTGGEAERATNLLEIFVRTIAIVAPVKGQFFLVLRRHGGDRHHTSREVQEVVQGQVERASCRKIQVRPGN